MTIQMIIIICVWLYAASVALSKTTTGAFAWISLFLAIGVSFYLPR